MLKEQERRHSVYVNSMSRFRGSIYSIGLLSDLFSLHPLYLQPRKAFYIVYSLDATRRPHMFCLFGIKNDSISLVLLCLHTFAPAICNQAITCSYSRLQLFIVRIIAHRPDDNIVIYMRGRLDFTNRPKKLFIQ